MPKSPNRTMQAGCSRISDSSPHHESLVRRHIFHHLMSRFLGIRCVVASRSEGADYLTAAAASHAQRGSLEICLDAQSKKAAVMRGSDGLVKEEARFLEKRGALAAPSHQADD